MRGANRGLANSQKAFIKVVNWQILFQMTRRKVATLALASLMFPSFPAWATQPNLKVCYISWFGPNSPEGKGPDFEVAQNWAKTKMKDATFTEIAFADIFKDKSASNVVPQIFVEPRRCDLVASNITISPERSKTVRLVPFYPGRTFVVSTKSSGQIRSILNFKNRKTSVVKGTSYETLLNEINGSLPKNERFDIEVTPKGGNLKKLLDNQIDFLAMDAGLAFHTAMKHPSLLRLDIPIGPIEQIGWIVGPHMQHLDKELRAYFQAEIANDKSNLNAVFSKYFNLDYRGYQRVVLAVPK